MVEVNEKNFTIEMSETLSFDNDVQDVYDEICDDIEYEVQYNADNYSESTIENMKRFLDHQLTDNDKIEILNNIVENYEYESMRADCEVTIFDKDGIFNSIDKWIDDNFDFEW